MRAQLRAVLALPLLLVPALALAQPAPPKRPENPMPTAVDVHHRPQAPVSLEAAQSEAKAIEAQLREPFPGEGGKPALRLVEVTPFGAGVVQHWQLSNGLRVLLAPDASAPVVALHTWVRVGSANEVAGKTGLAHLFEHLMFKSTRTRPAGTFDRVLEQLGASANAMTSFDWTAFHETVPPQHLATVLELEADRLTQLDLTAAALRSELEVVRNERREVVDNDADGVVDEALHKAIYGEHPYGHPTIGTAEDLEKLSLADAKDFHRQFYTPGRVTLVLAGGFDPALVLRDIARLYLHIPAGKDAAEGKPAAPPAKGSLITTEIDAGAERLAIAWRIVPGDHADHPALSVLAEVLFNADSARLQRKLVHDLQLASAASGSVTQTKLVGLFDVHVVLAPGKHARDALAAVDAGITALCSDKPVSEAELAAAKNRLRMEHFRELTGVDGRAETLGVQWTAFGDLAGHARWWQAVAIVSTSDLHRVARSWLQKGTRAIVIGTPPEPRVSLASGKGKRR